MKSMKDHLTAVPKLRCSSPGNWFNVIPDILFILVLLRMAHQEAKELLPAIAGGMDGIKDYFKFWNLVDWSLVDGIHR